MEEILNELIHKLTRMFWVFVIVLLALLLYAFWRVEAESIRIALSAETQYMIATVAILLTIIPIPLVFYYYSNKAKQAKLLKDERIKVDWFVQISRIRLLVFFLIGFYHVNFYLFTGDRSSQLFSLIVLVLLFLSKPSLHQFESDFN